MTVFWALVAQAVISITRILTTVTVGGRFEFLASGSEGIGSLEQLSLYYSAFGVLTVVISMHEGFVTTPMTVFLPKQEESRESKFSGHMLLGSLCFIGIAIGLVAAWIFWQYHVEGQMTASLMVVSFVIVLAPLQLLREFSRRWLLANLEVLSSALLEILFSLTFLAALCGMFLLAEVSAINAFVGIALMNTVALVVWWRFYGKGFSFTRDEASKQFTENFRYGRWAAAENFCSTVTIFFCVWYLNRQLGLASGGVYSACFNVMLLANPFLLGICSLLGARAAQEYTRNGWDALLKTLTQYGLFIFVVLSMFAVVLWLFGAELTNLLFSEKYQKWFDANSGGVNNVTPVLGLAVPCLGVSFVLATALLAIGRPNDNFFCALAGLALLVLINFSFGPSLDTAAISFVIAAAANAVFRAACLARAYAYRDILIAKV